MQSEIPLRRCWKSSTIAAWKQAARAENAAATGKAYAQTLLDLVKAFERVPYRVLRREASRLGYPLRILRLTIAAYKLPRVIRVGEAISDIIFAVRGMVAGSGSATTEMRLAMIHIVDAAIVAHPTVEPTLVVDDVSSEKAGEADDIAEELGSFTWMLVQLIRADDMEVSATKSLVSASNPSLGKAIEYKLQVEQANYDQSFAGSTRSTPNDSPSPPPGISPQEVSAPPVSMSIDRWPLWRGCRRGPGGG